MWIGVRSSCIENDIPALQRGLLVSAVDGSIGQAVQDFTSHRVRKSGWGVNPGLTWSRCSITDCGRIAIQSLLRTRSFRIDTHRDAKGHRFVFSCLQYGPRGTIFGVVLLRKARCVENHLFGDFGLTGNLPFVEKLGHSLRGSRGFSRLRDGASSHRGRDRADANAERWKH